MTAEENSKRYVSREEYSKKGSNVYSVIEQYKDTPVSVIDIWKNDRGGADVSIAVRNDEKFRHKGYASRALENGLKYFYEHPDIEFLVWGVNAENHPSIELAKKYGFEFYDDLGDGWQTYIIDKEAKNTMAYNRWLSQDYLAHHGVKGQKWGERNGPPYPLDSSKSDGHKLLSGSGSPQGKKKYKTSEKTSHQRAERKARTDKELDRARKLYGKNDVTKEELAALRRAKKDIDSNRVTDPEIQELITMDHMDRADDDTYSVWNSKKKTESLKNAKDNDMWELDFLEYTQNEEWANSLSPKFDKKRMLKEYSEYLDDRDAYSQKRLPKEQRKTGDEIRALRAEQQKKLESKTQKKSISDRINSFKDRILSGSKKEQEQIQSLEPITSEKAKTKRGESYEINDWNGNAQDTIKAFKSNPEPHINIARKAALQEARRVIGWYAKDNPEAKRIINMSDQELSKRFGLDFVSAYSHGTVEFDFGDLGTGDFVGHEITVEYDLNRRKVMNVSVNG